MEKLTENEYLKVPAQVNMALKVLNKDMEPENDLSEHCMKPYECPFLDYCKRQHGIPEDEPTVFDLYRMNWAKKLEHYHAGRLLFKDVREEGLSDKQQMQVECTLNHTEHIDKNGIREFLSGLSYPLYFLDFETLQQPIRPSPSMMDRNHTSRLPSSIHCISRRARMRPMSIRSSWLLVMGRIRVVP